MLTVEEKYDGELGEEGEDESSGEMSAVGEEGDRDRERGVLELELAGEREA